MPKYRLVINIMILLGLLAGMHLVSGRLQRLTPPREAVLTTPANSSTSGDQSSEPPAREQNPAGSGVTGQAVSGTVPGTNRNRLQPNELGKVMILEYHLIGDKEDRWERQYDNFRKDLERLYREGYRLISLVDYLRNSIRVPEGYTPVVLTFDDGSRGQFNYLEKDGQKVIDPRSAVGIILDFAREHPDFGTAATFYTLYPPFGQARYWQEKVRFLVEHGMDIGNHTANHVNLAKLSA
ncbi:MAG: polysaccharide deacetylase family protein, partial [Firmicutes bacterium]|nr:polysaccharide deacetylase family protein [Bacillota bacterium]